MAQGKKRPGKSTRKQNAGETRVNSHAPAKASAARGWKLPLAFATVVIAIAATTTWYKFQSSTEDSTAAADLVFPIHEPIKNTGPEAGYAGSSSCAECHQGIAESYSHIAMGRSVYEPTLENIIEDYTDKNEFYHEASDQFFRMTYDDEGKFYQTRFQKDPDGNVINELTVQVSYIIGSGNNSRSYMHREPDGKMYQLPVAWYPQENTWAMNPGYDNPEQINFSRRITHDCMFCHAAYPDVPAGADEFNYGESALFPEKLEAIDCERCHGPSAQHVALARTADATDEAIREATLNPANLSSHLQMEVCMQCHLETTSGKLPHSVHAVGAGIFGYRPGEPLEEYRYAFNHPEGIGFDDKFEIAGQAYRLRMSPCFTESEGRMTCTTCHDPHKVPQDRIGAAIQSCFECHKPADCLETMEIRLNVKDNCIQCHMPRRRTDDVVHVVMTDHYIQRRPPPEEELLAPKQEHAVDYKGDVVPYYPEEIDPELRDLYLGLAHISNSADLEKGLRYLDNHLKTNPPTFAPVYTRGVALKVLQRMEEAREALELSVKIRPDQPQAWMALGDLYEMMQNHDKSIACYQKAIDINPNISRAYNGKGTSLMLAGRLDEAEQAFRNAVIQDPFDENPRLNLSGIYLQRGEFQAAEAEARAALAVRPNRASGWAHLADCAVANRRPADAIWPALQALKYDKFNTQVFERLLAACKSAGAGPVNTTLQKSSDTEPFTASVIRCMMAIESEDFSQADDALFSASAVTTTPAAMPTAVYAALHANRRDLALTWGRQAMDAMPGHDEAAIRYASALRASGQTVQARDILQKNLDETRSLKTANALAWLFATAEDEALRNGRQASQMANQVAENLGQANVFILQTQAAAAAELGQFKQAEQIARSALDLAAKAGLKLESRIIQKQLADYEAGRPHRAHW